jgi:hypothetical protein
MHGTRQYDAPRIWGPATPGVGARWGPHMSGAPHVWCATYKAEFVAHILGCAAYTYLWSIKTWCAADNGPMDKGFPSSEKLVRAHNKVLIDAAKSSECWIICNHDMHVGTQNWLYTHSTNFEYNADHKVSHTSITDLSNLVSDIMYHYK